MSPRKVLLIGATSAVAAEVAKIYAERGDQLYLIARHVERLQALVASLAPNVVGHEAGDLSDLDGNGARLQRAFDRLEKIDVVLIAHGLLGDQIRSESELEHAREIVTTNFVSAVSLLIPLANFLERQGSGHLGVITSVAGERGRPRNYTYGASKGGLTRYLQGVRSRLHGSGVHVLNVKLGPTDTPMTRDHEKHALFGEKRSVARGIVRALEGRRHVVYLPPIWGAIMALVRVLPEAIFQRFAFLAGR